MTMLIFLCLCGGLVALDVMVALVGCLWLRFGLGFLWFVVTCFADDVGIACDDM